MKVKWEAVGYHGEWYVKEKHGDGSNQVVAKVCHPLGAGFGHGESTEGAARLLASAPLLKAQRDELLAACKEALRIATCVSRNEQAPQKLCDCYACEAANQLEAAIGNAEWRGE